MLETYLRHRDNQAAEKTRDSFEKLIDEHESKTPKPLFSPPKHSTIANQIKQVNPNN